MKTIAIRVAICIATLVAIVGIVWGIVCLNTVGLDQIKVASTNHNTGSLMEIACEDYGWHKTNFYRHAIGDRYIELNVGAYYASGWSESEVFWDGLLTLAEV